MRVLALDVAIMGCSVSISDTESLVSCVRRVDTDRGQAEILIPLIDDVSQESGIELSSLDIIAVTRGPGSFTGVRIGLATAKSLGLALNIPVIGLSTLDVIARKISEPETLCLIDTKRGDYYGQIGEGNEPRIWTEDEVIHYKGSVQKNALPDISIITTMAIETYQQQQKDISEVTTTPIYLRDAEVSQSKKKSLSVISEI